MCLLPEHQDKDLTQEALKDEWLRPFDEVLSVLRISSTWDSAKLSDCLKLLFREILVPTYRKQGTEDVDAEDPITACLREKVMPTLQNIDLTKRGLSATFERLLLNHVYVHTVFEQSSMSDLEKSLKPALPSLKTI